MYELQSRRSQTIECAVGTQQANQNYFFGQQPLLQSITGGQKVFVEAIELFAGNALSKSPISPANNVATAADVAGATLTLSVLGSDRYRNLPLSKLNQTWSTETGYIPFNMSNMLFCNLWGIDWTQCYVTTLVAVHAIPLSFLFTVYYSYSTDITADLQS